MRAKSMALLCAAMGVAAAGAAFAHPHVVMLPTGDSQVIANGQNHPRFIAGTSCESFGPIPGSSIGPAWYGLETAHHGPDAGDPGKGDGCYQTTGNVPPGQDDQNPAID